jgi:hypothetical protein
MADARASPSLDPQGRSPDPEGAPLLARLGAWLGPPLVAVAFVALARWTWGAWPDVLVDFGRELYAPWRLSEGAVLYRDLAWFNGPLSAAWNALLFEVFGASFATLVWANLALLAAFTALCFGLLRSISSPLPAAVACLCMLAVCGFGHPLGLGNYNFVAPYSHEVVHGSMLGLASLGCLRVWDGWRSLAWVLLAGLALGLCFLTKAEVFLAALLADLTALALFLASEPKARAERARIAAGFAGAALLPLLAALTLLARSLPSGEALRGALGSWPWVFAGGAEELAFYRQGMGLDQPIERLAELGAWSARWLLVLVPALALAWKLPRGSPRARMAAIAMLALSAGVTWWALDERDALNGSPFASWPLTRAARPFPLFVLALGGFLAWRLAHSREARRTGRVELALCVFAFALLGKMLLNTRLIHYGFALALPALLLVAVALLGWIPAALEARGRAGWVFRAAALAMLAVGTQAHLRRTDHFLERKSTVVGAGRDAFRADVRGSLVNAALADLAQRAAPGETLAVFPEGVMLNWLARRANPTPYVNFMPSELLLFGEPRIAAAFRAHPPDWVLLVHKDTGEYGYPLFGPDYGRELATWIQESYEPVSLHGQPPLQPNTLFGIQLMRRR